MVNRHRITRFTACAAVIVAALCIAIGGAQQALGKPAVNLLSGTTVELAWDAQAFISEQLRGAQVGEHGLQWREIIDLDNPFEISMLGAARKVDVLGVAQTVAARTFAHYGIGLLKSGCLTGAMMAAYANDRRVSDSTSKREMLYALAYTQFERPGAGIEEGIAVVGAMMDYPEGVAAYNLGVISGAQACNVDKSEVRMI